MPKSLALLLLLPILAFAGDASPLRPVPKDTLPAQLNLKDIPLGLELERPLPADNPLKEEVVELGRRLFFDPILSADSTVACASCHDPAHGFASPDARAVGIRSQKGRRNAPSLLNRAYATNLFWDGREKTLETQALQPIADPLEMGSNAADAIKRLQTSKDYPGLFAKAFTDGMTEANLGKALASFERTLLSGGSRIDRFRAAEKVTLTTEEKQGLWLFESRGKCWKCHSGANFSDEQFHNTGISWGTQPPDLGRFEITKKEEDRGKFKTPTLRGVSETAPYMHDGSMATLEEVVEYYNRGGNKNPHLDSILQPLDLSKEDVQHLVAFLKALSAGK